MMTHPVFKIAASLLLVMLFAIAGFSQTFRFDGTNEIIGQHFHVFTDSSDVLTFDEAFQLWNDGGFKKSEAQVPNLGATEMSTWFAVEIENNSDLERIVLEVSFPTIDQINYWKVSNAKVESQNQMGNNYPYSQRQFDHQNYIYDLELEKGHVATYFFEVSSGDQMAFPISIGSFEDIAANDSDQDVFNGIYFGIILVMLLYNIFIYFSTRDRSYLLYCAYLLTVGMTQAVLLGYCFRYMWPNSPWTAKFMVLFFSATIAISAMMFMQNFLNTKHYTPKLNKVLNIFIGLYAVSLILAIFGQRVESQQMIQAISGSAIFTLVVAIVIARKGSRPAKFFVFAWVLFLMGVVVWFMKDFGVLPYNNFTTHVLQIGSAIEVVLLSFALADRINILKKEKEASQLEALNALQENERIISEQNIILEAKVQERTLELKESYEELKTTQAQLVDAEKMASLGQMTAGIAHELNNPINFVSSNINPLKRDIDDLVEVLDKYADLDKADPKISDKLIEIESFKADIEMDFVREEINQLLNGIQEGASRTSEIVKGLRVFSRLDEDALKQADINHGLDSTLVILKNRIKGEITITKNYDETMEKLNCYPGKINQVFMNIITNAIQSIQSSDLPIAEREIKIETKDLESDVLIKISDNGIGIPENIQGKIFDPFFTTKEVGEGTGLGLSIVLGIINDHQGKISVNSNPGEGAEFEITLPKGL